MKFAILLSMWFLALTASATLWQPDVLGDSFEIRYVEHPDDYAGKVRSTIVRLHSDSIQPAGILYIHGFNDYFFQADMAREFAAHGYAFYAVDLRKYGRSIMPGQQMFQVHDLREYFADIDSALVQMKADGVRRVALMGHSTGGLTAALYMSEYPAPMVDALILNSPFLDWNMSDFLEDIAIPVVACFSKCCPDLKIPQGGNSNYAKSLLKRYDGEWDYNTEWKLPLSPPVEASWLRAIDEAHADLQAEPKIMVPVLLMHSDASVSDDDGYEAYSHKDAVLDVDDISRFGRGLGPCVCEVTIVGGLHDLVLSAPSVRTKVYDAIFEFLKNCAF